MCNFLGAEGWVQRPLEVVAMTLWFTNLFAPGRPEQNLTVSRFLYGRGSATLSTRLAHCAPSETASTVGLRRGVRVCRLSLLRRPSSYSAVPASSRLRTLRDPPNNISCQIYSHIGPGLVTNKSLKYGRAAAFTSGPRPAVIQSCGAIAAAGGCVTSFQFHGSSH